jgi:hypothetical protein
MSQSTEPCLIDDYHTSEEITEMWNRNRERSKWTLQQHEEWDTFLYYQCLAQDRRYKPKSPSECLPDTALTSLSLSTFFCAILIFHDNIYDCVVWSKDHIYEFVCPDCSIREIASIMMGGLFGLFYIVHSSLANWKHKRWLPFALALFWTTRLLAEARHLYKTWSG